MSRMSQGTIVLTFMALGLLIVCPQLQAQKPRAGTGKAKSPVAPSKAQLNTALFEAVRKHDADKVWTLIQRGADPNTMSQGSPVLVLVASGGDRAEMVPVPSDSDTDIAAILLDAGAKPDAVGPNGETALFMAARNGSKPMCELLLQRHAAIDHPTKEGLTPLMAAVLTDNLDVMDYLLANKANVNAQTSQGVTPLACAILSQGHSLLNLFMPSTINRALKRKVFEMLLSHRADMKATLEDGSGLLTIAASVGDLEAARLLLEKGANVNEQDKEGFTPLMRAAHEGKAPMVRFLLDHKADPNSVTSHGVAALQAGTLKGSFSIVQMLLKQGADPSATASDGSTALKLAQDQHLTGLVNLLKASGAKE